MVSDNQQKVIVHILYPCYICANEYSGAGQVITHVRNIHGYILESRQVGHHRPPDNHYAFENDIKKKWDIQHFGCPSCWFHCPKNFETLMEHMMQEHKPDKVPGFVHKNQDEEDELASDITDAEEGEHVQQVEMTSDEEQKGLEEGHADEQQPADDNQATLAKKEDTPSSVTSDGTSNPGSSSAANQDNNSRTFFEAETEVAKDIMQKMSDLNDMFKKLFK